MRKSTEERIFTIEVTYSAKDLNEICKWYINQEMPPIYSNYDLNKEENASMIEEEAVKTLMNVGSNQVMTEYFQNIIIFTPEEADDYIEVLMTEEE
tara:strand:- start:79 stop:366 length:288 start_codon:yes stop_codon:yes gene_type:complete